MIWEYKVLPVEGAHNLFESVLNIQAAEGWELVYSIDTKNILIFRRPTKGHDQESRQQHLEADRIRESGIKRT